MEWTAVICWPPVGGRASPTTTMPVTDCTEERMRNGYVGWSYGCERGCRNVGARTEGRIMAASRMRTLKRRVYDFDRP